jgi:pimeloyl-ACP methyl ester carboxylesterase
MGKTEAGQNQPVSTTGSQLTAENRSVEIDRESFVYRRFGNADTDAPPLVCLQHFRGNLDNWDPALVDRLARDREVILLANRGVGASTGVVPDNVPDMTRDVLRFVDALGLPQVDLLGFSLGGYIAQELALVRPRLVRRIVLAGTAPQESWLGRFGAVARTSNAPVQPRGRRWLASSRVSDCGSAELPALQRNDEPNVPARNVARVGCPPWPARLLEQKKCPVSRHFESGSDGTRTRDLRRDRPAL